MAEKLESFTAAGKDIELVNTPMDAESFFVDGMKGVSVVGSVTKVNLFEQIVDPSQTGKIFGKYRVSLVIPNDQFLVVADILKRIADEIRGTDIVAAAAAPEAEEK